MQVDFLPSKAMTAEEIAQQQSLFESLAKATRSITVMVDKEPIEMQVCPLFFAGPECCSAHKPLPASSQLGCGQRLWALHPQAGHACLGQPRPWPQG